MKLRVRARLLLGAAAVVGVSTAVAAPPLSKELTALAGKPFSGVRSKLVDGGWGPVETNLTTAKGTLERERGQAGKFLEAGFPEIERCTGGERNYCFLNYSRGGKCLRVRTLGVLDLPARDPVVHGVGDACPSKQRAKP